jgi:hypothetical protein
LADTCAESSCPSLRQSVSPKATPLRHFTMSVAPRRRVSPQASTLRPSVPERHPVHLTAAARQPANPMTERHLDSCPQRGESPQTARDGVSASAGQPRLFSNPPRPRTPRPGRPRSCGVPRPSSPA